MVREMKHTEIGEIPAEWELQTFEETFRMLSNNTLPRADLNNRGGTVRNIHYGDILTRFGEVLDCEKDEVPYLNDGALLTASAQVLQDGDVILADTAEDDTVGKATEVYGLGKGRMVAGLHTIPCRVKKGDFVPKWLGYYMNSPIYHNQVLPYVTGIKVSSISRAAISETLIAVPPLKEQKVIVAALSEVDQLLVEQKKVVSKLRDFKRGCLYLMFPQEGADIPQMREPGYGEPWEQCKLGELVEIGDIDHRMPVSVEDGIPYLMTGDFIGENELNFHDVKKVSMEDYNQLSRKIKPEKGDILFARYASVGTVRYVDFIRKFLISYSCAIIKESDKINSSYLYHYLTSEGAQNQIKLETKTGSQANIGINSMKKYIVVPVPPKFEQEKIGAYFTYLDTLITLHQQKLNKYAQIKKAMMSELITGKIKLV